MLGLLAIEAAWALPGDLDRGFGVGGAVITGFGFGSDSARAVTSQPDGKILVAATIQDASIKKIAVLRYHPGGAPDASFGALGRTVTALSDGNSEAAGIALQPDGKIVVGGHTSGGSCNTLFVPTNCGFVLLRYNANGSPDPTFGTGGAVTATVSSFHIAAGIAIQPDGKIVLAGTTRAIEIGLADTGGGGSSGANFSLIRHHPDGTPDAAFGTGGKTVIPVGSSDDFANALALQPDGRIVVAGSAKVGGVEDFAIVRTQSNGALDAGFGTGGKRIIPVGAANDIARAVALQADGKIVVAGEADLAGTRDVAVIRLNADGTLDSGFGSAGKAQVVTGSAGGSANALVLQSDGKILLGGKVSGGGQDDAVLVRLNADGSPDPDFGPGSRIVFALSDKTDALNALALQAGGAVLAAGTSADRVLVARFSADGVPDPALASAGFAFTSVGNGSAGASAIARSADGKLLVAGYASLAPGQGIGLTLLKLNPDGTPDAGFGTGGRVVGAFDGVQPDVHAMLVQPDGRILLAGGDNWTHDFVLIRYLPDGVLDTGFGTGGKTVTTIGTSNHGASAAVLLPDGGILLAGSTFDSAFDLLFTLVKYRQDGSLDPAFGTGGVVSTLLDGGGAEVKALALQPDGKILAAGSVGGRFALVRYNPDGTLDAGFGAGGTVSTAIGLGVRANAIALRGDGRILLAGNRTITTSGSGDSAVLAQYLPDGTLDASFGAGGTILQDGGYSSVNANAVAIQRNGKIVVTGSATVGGSADLAVLRLLPNGALDGGFGSNGARAVSLGNGADAGNAILIDPAGGILAAGSASGLVGVVRLAGDSSTPADLGADGRSDVFWQNSSTTQTVLWQMNGLSIGSAISPATVGDAHWKLVGVGDFDGDGRADLLWQHRDAGSAGTGMVVVWFMNSGVIASAGSPGTVSDPAWRVQGVGDFNGDGKADILWKNTATGQVLIWEMYGLSITAAGSPNTIADLGWVVQGVGDFNGDGSADVLWKHTGTGQTVVWLMNGLGIAGAGSPGTVADLGWQVQGVGDFDGDGKSDVLWRHDVSGTTVIWRMDGVGVASTASPATVIEPGWRIQGVGDYDGDGRADVFWRNLSSGSTYVWLMNGTGIGSAGSPATVADLDWQVQNPK